MFKKLRAAWQARRQQEADRLARREAAKKQFRARFAVAAGDSVNGNIATRSGVYTESEPYTQRTSPLFASGGGGDYGGGGASRSWDDDDRCRNSSSFDTGSSGDSGSCTADSSSSSSSD